MQITFLIENCNYFHSALVCFPNKFVVVNEEIRKSFLQKMMHGDYGFYVQKTRPLYSMVNFLNFKWIRHKKSKKKSLSSFLNENFYQN